MESFEASMRLGLDFNETWNAPNVAEVQLEMFRKRGKPFSWRPLIDPHIFLFYDSSYVLTKALEEVHRLETSTVRLKKTSFRAYWYSGTESSAFRVAREVLKEPSPRIYEHPLNRLLLDIEEFRKSREDERKSLGFSAHANVGVALFMIDLDSFPKGDVSLLKESSLLEQLLFEGGPERVFLCLVSKSAASLPVELLTLIEFGCFMGKSAKFVEPFITDSTFVRRPLVFRDPLGKFYQAWRDESGELYERRYSLNELGEETLRKRAESDQAFVDWIEALDDGS